MPDLFVAGLSTAAAWPAARRRNRVLKETLDLEDFGRLAKDRLPRSVYAYVSNGAEDMATLRENRAQFAAHKFVTRVLRDVSKRDQGRTVFGRRWSSPFAIAPMGAAAVVGYDADNRMARAAQDADIPFILSANSITPLEELHRTNPDAWFGAYQSPDHEKIRRMIERVGRAGFETYVLTVDVAVGSNRQGERRAGYSMPLRATPKLALDGITHPGWLLGTAARTIGKRGIPVISNLEPVGGPTVLTRDVSFIGGHASLSWAEVKLIRSLWPGRFVLKGILSPDDARIAREHGCDGVVVSNHGGRQLDGSASPLDVLAAVKAASGDMTIIADSGFRRGTDVLKALALGADLVLIARPFLYAAVLAGEEGVAHAIRLLKREIDIGLALLGLERADEVGPSVLLGQER